MHTGRNFRLLHRSMASVPGVPVSEAPLVTGNAGCLPPLDCRGWAGSPGALGGRCVSMDRSLAALGTGQINCKRDSHKGIWSQLKDFNAHYALEKPSPRKQVTKSLNQQEFSFRNLV